MKIKFDKSVVGYPLKKDIYNISNNYKVFRHVLKSTKEKDPEAMFVIKFQLKNMNAKINKIFSLLPMCVLLCMKGFREKYYLTNYDTNECIGVYRWQSVEDAKRYASSIAVEFMTKRSVEGSIHYKIFKGDELICEF